MCKSVERDFLAYLRPLYTVTSFKYMGWVLTVEDENWSAVVGNLWKEQKYRKSWEWLARFLGWEGASPRV